MRMFVNKPDYIRPSGPMYGPGAVLDLDCVVMGGTGAVGFKAINGWTSDLRILDSAGDGGFSLTLYNRSLPESELPARQRAWEEKVQAQSEANNRAIEEGVRNDRAEACNLRASVLE